MNIRSMFTQLFLMLEYKLLVILSFYTEFNFIKQN